VRVLSEACHGAVDSAALVQLRSVVWLFCGSLDRYNFTTRAIRASLDGHLQRYITLLLEEGREDVVSALRNDKFEALKIENAVDYARLIVDLKLDAYLHPLQKPLVPSRTTKDATGAEKKKAGQLTEPVTMIFSNSVPRLIQISKNFVFDLASFVDLSSPNCVQVLVQALDRFLQEVVNGQLLQVLDVEDPNSPTKSVKGAKTKKSTAAALHAMQISLNAHILSKETLSLMEYASSLSLTPDENNAAAAQAEKSERVFQHAKMLGEDRMFGYSAATIEDILSRGDTEFEWAPAKVETHPSNYVLELSSYLMATFPAFSALPAETREALYYITCKTISSRVLAQPNLPHVRKILLTAFTRAHIDLTVLEGFAAGRGC